MGREWFPGKAGLPHPRADIPPKRTGIQKGNKSLFFTTKSKIFRIFADKEFFSPAPNRINFYTFPYVCLQNLTIFPQNHRLFSARARIVCRKKHFFSPQREAKLSACQRISALIPEFFLPKYGVLVCFFPHDFLFETRKALPPEERKESRKPQWLTRPASSGTRDSPPAYTMGVQNEK